MKTTLLVIALVCVVPRAHAQLSQENADKFSVWLPLQLLPTLTLYNDAHTSNFGFEWEVTPLLYSFGINRYVSPWYTFIVEPTARFTGSVELSVAGQIYTSKLGSSYFGSYARIMGFIPLSERGEHLTLNLGVGAHSVAGTIRVFKIAGISTLFGMLHLNLKHADNPTAWNGSLEFRVF